MWCCGEGGSTISYRLCFVVSHTVCTPSPCLSSRLTHNTSSSTWLLISSHEKDVKRSRTSYNSAHTAGRYCCCWYYPNSKTIGPKTKPSECTKVSRHYLARSHTADRLDKCRLIVRCLSCQSNAALRQQHEYLPYPVPAEEKTTISNMRDSPVLHVSTPRSCRATPIPISTKCLPQICSSPGEQLPSPPRQKAATKNRNPSPRASGSPR